MKSLKVTVDANDFSTLELTLLSSLLYPLEAEFTMSSGGSDVKISKVSSDNGSASLVFALDASRNGGTSQTGLVTMPYDPLAKSFEVLDHVLKHRVSFSYRLATSMPFEYNVVPESIRARFLRRGNKATNLMDHVSVQKTRMMLFDAISKAGFPLKRSAPRLIVTHDVDTDKGLESSLKFKKIEDDLGIQATWFLPSNEYDIGQMIAADLGDGANIGSHDVKHDGKLIRIHDHSRLVDRLSQSRLELGRVFNREIVSFRSPLLQFSGLILSALKSAGYTSDYSLPCWEPVNPAVMSGFGGECASSLMLNSIIETPLTLFQDHQMFHVLEFSISEAIKIWLDQARSLVSIGGDVVLLTHPDYNFSQDLEKYRELLEGLSKVVSDAYSQESPGAIT